MRRLFFTPLLILSINNIATAQTLTRSRYLMGTLFEATVTSTGDASAADAAFGEVARLESVLSTYIQDSEVSRLNRAAGKGPVAVSADLWNILMASSEVWRASGGTFDPTYASSAPARGFGLLALDPERRSAALPAGAHLDFGGIGKGYALDAAGAVLRGRGVTRALLNFGGQIAALGAWEVRAASRTLRLRDQSISGSGDSERPGHIVDPRTGASIHRPEAVFVIMASATMADAWSKPLYLEGPRGLPKDFPGCALAGAAETGHCEELTP